MNLSFFMPTRVLAGRGVIAQNADRLRLGRHALLVTGKSSAKRSGALEDVTAALAALGIGYTVFDGITENPPLLTCFEAGQIAADAGADFVIGIGGGSPMDAAKAVAAFAANPTIQPIELYDPEKRLNPSLPIVAIPTTSGTGSEVNPYAVITLPDGERKKTFTCDASWPRIAFVDPKYTDTLPYGTTVSTALDAFAHAMESYLSPKSSAFSEAAALFAAERIWDVLSQYPDAFTPDMRDTLSAASTAAGMAISVTGTGFPHPLGYSLTLLDGIPHGRACAAFAEDYITYNEKDPVGKERIARFAAACGTTPKVMKTYLPALAEVELCFTDAEIERRVALVEGAKNYQNSPYVISGEEMRAIYKRLFAKKRR
ncbi:MAG: iron-containing alcohol dehydrogenase [Ruminococcaceae bacterium]|nr:iron-containing alcohol dehydrogenase [Oscillospiraceae bacterium]